MIGVLAAKLIDAAERWATECCNEYWHGTDQDGKKQFIQLAREVEFAKLLGDRREDLWVKLDRRYRLIMNQEPNADLIPVFEQIKELRKQLGLTND